MAVMPQSDDLHKNNSPTKEGREAYKSSIMDQDELQQRFLCNAITNSIVFICQALKQAAQVLMRY